jgi:Mn2+/Fe2+ NRAMP family transporter
MIGVGMNCSSISPIRALFWSAIINGIVAVPVMVVMMVITANPEIMGKFPVSGVLKTVGWAATFIMAAAVAGMGIAESTG